MVCNNSNTAGSEIKSKYTKEPTWINPFCFKRFATFKIKPYTTFKTSKHENSDSRQFASWLLLFSRRQIAPFIVFYVIERINRSILLFLLSASILAIELLSTSSLACDSLCPPLHISVCDVITQFSLILTAFVLVFSEIFPFLSRLIVTLCHSNLSSFFYSMSTFLSTARNYFPYLFLCRCLWLLWSNPPLPSHKSECRNAWVDVKCSNNVHSGRRTFVTE